MAIYITLIRCILSCKLFEGPYYRGFSVQLSIIWILSWFGIAVALAYECARLGRSKNGLAGGRIIAVTILSFLQM
jgi:hypothetical protein